MIIDFINNVLFVAKGVQFKNPTNDEIITSRFKLLLGTLDLQARAIICNMHHHNGSCSCLYCEEMGLVVPSGKGYCRCYPFSDDVVPRNKERLEQNALEAQAMGDKVSMRCWPCISCISLMMDKTLTPNPWITLEWTIPNK